MKWCPYTLECEFAAERVQNSFGISSQNIVNCQCGNSFCFKCGEEQHWPADCQMFKKW